MQRPKERMTALNVRSLVTRKPVSYLERYSFCVTVNESAEWGEERNKNRESEERLAEKEKRQKRHNRQKKKERKGRKGRKRQAAQRL